MSNISLFTAPCIYFCLGLAQTRGAHYTWVEGLFECQKAISVVRIHDHMLHRTGLLTEAQVRGGIYATSDLCLCQQPTCASVNNPRLKKKRE